MLVNVCVFVAHHFAARLRVLLSPDVENKSHSCVDRLACLLVQTKNARPTTYHLLLIATLRQVHVLEVEWFRVPNRCGIFARIFPRGGVRKLLVVAQSFALLRLVLFTKVRAARLLTLQRVAAY